MSADEYVPSDEQVRGRYCDGTYVQTGHTTEGNEFDAWLARVRRDAAREALGSLQSFARECMFNEDLAAEDLAGWHHTWAAALSHRANHYPHPDDEEVSP